MNGSRFILRTSLTSDVPSVKLTLNSELISKIAEYNGGMTAAEVYSSLNRGEEIYTNFNRYKLL